MQELFRKLPNLKSLIKIDDNSDSFPKYPQIYAPRISNNPSLIGHAYDYFLQLFCMRLNTPENEIENIDSDISIFLNELKDIKDQDEAFQFESEVRNRYYIAKKNDWNDFLTKQSLIQGKIDQISRSGIDDNDTLYAINDDDFLDLQSLIELSEKYEKRFSSKNIFVSNPMFGYSISRLISGADADIIIDEKLIEIKTEANFTYKGYHWQQLFGYYILSLLTPNCEFKISKLAMWNPRYCIMVSIDIERIHQVMNVSLFVDEFIGQVTHKDFANNRNMDIKILKNCIEDVRETWKISRKNFD